MKFKPIHITGRNPLWERYCSANQKNQAICAKFLWDCSAVSQHSVTVLCCCVFLLFSSESFELELPSKSEHCRWSWRQVTRHHQCVCHLNVYNARTIKVMLSIMRKTLMYIHCRAKPHCSVCLLYKWADTAFWLWGAVPRLINGQLMWRKSDTLCVIITPIVTCLLHY